MKRKIAAIMAADVVGYSKLVADDEEDAIKRLINYRQIFSEFIDRGGGRIFNTAGDAVLAEFSSAVEALRAAIDIQESVETWNAEVDPSRQMRFRIGMTVGDVIEREGDLLGDAVNVAARLEGLAQPGGICLSKVVHDQVGNKLHAKFEDIGDQRVKNLPDPIHVFRVNLGADDQASAREISRASAKIRRRSALRQAVSMWKRRFLFGAGMVLCLSLVACLAESGRPERNTLAPEVRAREPAQIGSHSAEEHPSIGTGALDPSPTRTDTPAPPQPEAPAIPSTEQASTDAASPSDHFSPEPTTTLAIAGVTTPVLVPLPAWSAHLLGFVHTPFAANSVSFASDGRTLISAYGDGLIRLWNTSTGKLIRTFDGKPNGGDNAGVVAISLSPDGMRALSAEGNKTKLWDVRSGHLLRTMGGYEADVDAVTFFPDGQRTASVGPFSLKIRSASTGVIVRDVQIDGLPRSLVISPNGKYAGLGSSDGAAVYDTANGRRIRALPVSPSGVNAVAFTSTGQALLTGGDDEVIRLWDFAGGRQVRTFEGSDDSVVAVIATPNGQNVISATKAAIITIWNLQSGVAVRTIPASSAPKALAVSRDGRLLAAAGEDGLLNIWRLSDGALLITLFETDGTGVAFTPDGHFATDADPSSAFQLKVGGYEGDMDEYAKTHRVADLSPYIRSDP